MNEMFSLWIVPSGETKQILQQVISDLSVTHKGPDFEPHMTLIGNVLGDEKTIVEKAGILAQQLKPFPLILNEISFSTTYFQSVFARVKATAMLMDANMKAKEIYGVENTVFMPHISLLYGNHSMDEREKIASEVVLPHDLSFTAEKLVVVPSTENPKEWIYLSELSLR